MISSTIIDYSCGLLIEKGHKKKGLIFSIFSNLTFLGFFKYFNFTFENFYSFLLFFNIDNSFLFNIPKIALPIGISFYTFQTMSYTIDVYRGNVSANRNFINFATYVTMFPQLVAGPIVRYIDIEDQLKNNNIILSNFSNGVQRFIIGLGKKMLIANSCAYVADTVFSESVSNLSMMHAWLGVIAYSFQIYFDFSGYSDMAIGLGKIFGFNLKENFNYPYISKSIKEFWRRWHISLSSWFRDYLYISLGGNRNGKARTYINLIIVFFITGLWHGASWNFVVWGLYHGFFIILEKVGFDKLLNRLWSPIQHIYTLLIVVVGWVFFRATDLKYAWGYVYKMFSLSAGSKSIASYISFYTINLETIFVLSIAALFSMPIKAHIQNQAAILNIGGYHKIVPYIRGALFILLFIISIAYVSTETYNPFIYFRF